MNDTIDIHTILVTWLRDKGYDGLAGHDCGCGVDNLAACGAVRLTCLPAYKRVCPRKISTTCTDCDTKTGGLTVSGDKHHGDMHCYRPERLPPPPLPGRGDLDNPFWSNSLAVTREPCPSIDRGDLTDE